MVPSYCNIYLAPHDQLRIGGMTPLATDPIRCHLPTLRFLYCVLSITITLFLIKKVPYEDLLDASELLIQALTLRREYCRPAEHSFPSTTARFLHTNEQNDVAHVETIHEEKKTVEGRHRS